MSIFNKSVYLVTDDSIMDFDTLYTKVELALQGGVGLLQFREKKSSSKVFYAHGLKIKALCKKYNVPLIINDRLDIAQAIDADGVHLGQSDLPLTVAKKILDPKKIIGISANTVETALDAQKNGADYIGVGAVFPTNTKNDAVLVSENTLSEIQSAVSIPIVAIGGITLENASSIINHKIDSIAVVSAILGQDDPKKATQYLNDLFSLV
ncbi:thiamine phosphate synthase [Marinisporobacter balticus]|uniref:Thiamine-phosphate synthase n=1 Tax=Marinisporobacter balticus TaxID=2018667 RepID=A0A4R2K9F6_9FIRM|nr:thiamine phosphate synthase [Marinisporobacter balticus]TCO69354.1 thiamine-phosphate diphosphorylase [Marinisporobacter balticus]